MNELELTVKRTIAAPREKIFEAWLTPAKLAMFMRTARDGLAAPRVETDAVKGGKFLIVMATVDREVPHTGTYLEIDPHSRIAFTWESPHSPEGSVVTLDLAEPTPGMTEITLHQVKFHSEGSRRGHEEGWSAILDHVEGSLN
ncbi:SRPBCC domain-containing protein [Aquibium sp. ELW1220]|uniref:SRPBCC family protein n=1 Tax=Aquibium sp. ELW1220 TaxID=2976766 RepID=UPI0025AF44E1|nr:SRPBCC domain-containing protein [Aquibium sp. ELW1220]MDN2579574.1 SRPBCC domain-containing protein [Aquibium sp. ELW1220]